MKQFSLLLLFLNGILAYSQDLTVPEEILERLETKVVTTPRDTFTFRVAYPQNYNAEESYECYLGLSGGTQSLKIVNYCYAAWFQSGYFANYITILPVNTYSDSTSFLDYDPKRMERMMLAIEQNFPLNNKKWIVGGTSNGGIAAFDLVQANPNRFKAVIVAPGMIEEETAIKGDWSHIDVILAYGDQDKKEWIKMSKQTGKRLKKIARSVQIVALTDQGHILPISFNVDRIYDNYFLE